MAIHKLKKSTKSLSVIKILSIAILTLGILIIIPRLFFNPSGINEIAAPQPIDVQSTSCYPDIASVQLNTACASSLTGYRMISYRCRNGKSGTYGGPKGNCLELAETLRDAGKVCGTICVRSSPSPSPLLSPTPTPKPSPSSSSCTSSLKDIVYDAMPVENACSLGYVHTATFICYDGFTGRLGDSKTCSAQIELEKLAISRCSSAHSCLSTSPTPTPTAKPSSYPSPVSTTYPSPVTSPKPTPTY